MAPLYTASKVIQFSLPLIVLFFISKETFRRESLTIKQFFEGNILGLFFFGALLFTYWILKNFPFVQESAPLILEKLQALGAGTLPKFIVLAAFISFIHAFLEEYYWRWYVHREVRAWLSPFKASLVSSAAFTCHHVIVINAYLPESIKHWGIFFFPAYVFVGGLIWALIYERTRSITLTWISHIWADLAIMWIAAMMVF